MEDSVQPYISPKVSDIIVSKFSSKNQLTSPKAPNFNAHDLSMQVIPPIHVLISKDLQSEYSKALNYIEILKLEKNNLKAYLFIKSVKFVEYFEVSIR